MYGDSYNSIVINTNDCIYIGNLINADLIIMIILYFLDLLEPPTNIELQFQWNNDLLQAVLSWEQPFTLNITDQGYERNITYTVFVNRNSTYEVHNISATQFTYNLNYSSLSVPQSNRDICNNNYYTTFQVSAINRIGTGERSELIFLRDALCTSGYYSFEFAYNLIMFLIML